MMNVLIAFANSAADRWVTWVVAASLDATLLLAGIGLVWFAIRNRVAPQVGYGRFLRVPLILLAVVSVPQLRAASDAAPADPQNPASPSGTPGQRNSKAEPEEARSSDRQEFAIRVVGPNGKPIPEAVVELRMNPGLTAEQVHQGKLVKRGPYGAFVATDARGQLMVEIPRAPASLDVYIERPGYGPYWAGWSTESHAEPIPSHFTAELEAAWSVGGIIVDAEGKPLKGVTVGPGIEFKKRPGDHRQMRGGSNVKTDAAGRWQFDSVPVSMSEVFVEINHPGFSPVRRPLTPRRVRPRARPATGCQDRSESRSDGDRQSHRRSRKADRRRPGAHQVPQRSA